MTSTLSIEKLKSYIKTKGLIPTKIFTLMSNECIFVEVASPDTGNTFMLYIPSNYNLEYTVAKTSISTKKYDIESIKLDDIKKDKNVISGISKLLNRFIKCVKKIPYKIVVVSGNLIAFINRSNAVEFYTVKNEEAAGKKYSIKIFVDLEHFFKKKNLWTDIDIIKKNIFMQFEHNSDVYFNRIKDITDGTEYIKTMESIKEAKDLYSKNIVEFNDILSELCVFEKNIILQIQSLIDKPNTESNIITFDIEKTQDISKKEMILSRLHSPKTNMINCILELTSKIETIYIVTECVYFQVDASISKIYKTFENLKFSY